MRAIDAEDEAIIILVGFAWRRPRNKVSLNREGSGWLDGNGNPQIFIGILCFRRSRKSEFAIRTGEGQAACFG